MQTWNDRRTWKWPIMFASLIAMTAMTSTGKADVLVSSLEESSAPSVAVRGFVPAFSPQEDQSLQMVDNTQSNRLALLTTIMFFPGNTPPGGGSGGGGGNGSTGGNTGGGTTPTGSDAPEPATMLTGLVGSGLLGMYSLVRRRGFA
jgi:hypothetical protein